MSRKIITPHTTLGTHLAWVLPNPVWNALVLDSRPVTHVYTVCNHTTSKVIIHDVKLVRGDDVRLSVIGGTGVAGFVLHPEKTCPLAI